MTTTEYKKPIPVAALPGLTKPFWDAAKRHELVLPRCKKCSRWHFYPREQCPFCLSADIEYAPASGKGRVWSFTTIFQPVIPAFRDEAPYNYVIIELNEGVHMIGNVIGWEGDPKELPIDALVEAYYDDVTPECTIVKWKLV